MSLIDRAKNCPDNALSKKGDAAIKKLIRNARRYVEAAVSDPHTGWCRCERCEHITFFEE